MSRPVINLLTYIQYHVSYISAIPSVGNMRFSVGGLHDGRVAELALGLIFQHLHFVPLFTVFRYGND